MVFATLYEENTYRKREKALKRYFQRAYKYLIFKVLPTLKEKNKIDGYYELELPSSELFKIVYGRLYLRFYVKDDNAYFEDIFPSELLVSCYEKDLPIYKGVPYETTKDFKKIKIAERLL